MPNWCDNEVKIYGTKEILETILEKGKTQDDEFSMNQFVPVPEFEQTTRKITGSLLEEEGFKNALAGNKGFTYDNWYDWSIGNWGTKWDMENAQTGEIQKDVDNYMVAISYQTAWSPNMGFWATFSELYPVQIEHQYYEEGMMFIGEADYSEGSINDYCTEVTEEMLLTIGAVANDEGGVDWETDQDYDLSDLFPLSR